MSAFKLLLLALSLCLAGNQAFAQRALIPMPQEVSWQHGSLDIKQGLYISAEADLVQAKAMAQEITASWKLPIHAQRSTKSRILHIALLPQQQPAITAKESYTLTIDKDSIALTANTEAGLFYGLQTLKQIELQDNTAPYGCSLSPLINKKN